MITEELGLSSAQEVLTHFLRVASYDIKLSQDILDIQFTYIKKLMYDCLNSVPCHEVCRPQIEQL